MEELSGESPELEVRERRTDALAPAGNPAAPTTYAARRREWRLPSTAAIMQAVALNESHDEVRSAGSNEI